MTTHPLCSKFVVAWVHMSKAWSSPPAISVKALKEEAERSDAIPVAMVNRKQLVDLLIEHEVLVKRVAYELINLDVEMPSNK